MEKVTTTHITGKESLGSPTVPRGTGWQERAGLAWRAWRHTEACESRRPALGGVPSTALPQPPCSSQGPRLGPFSVAHLLASFPQPSHRPHNPVPVL